MAETQEKPTETPKAEETPASTENDGGAEDPLATIQEPAKLRRPDRNQVLEKEAVIRAEIKGIDSKIDAIVKKVKTAQNAMSNQNDGAAGARAELKRLRSQKDELLRERQAIFAARDELKESKDTQMKEMAKLKSSTGGKYRSIGDVNAAIARLERQQETTSMSLSKEKELLKEIDELKKAKKVLQQSASVSGDSSKVAVADSGARLGEIKAALDKIKKESERHQEVLNKVFEKRKDSPVQHLIKERDELKEQKNGKIQEIQALWTEFKSKNAEWKKNQDEWKVYKAARDKAYKAEREKHAEEARIAREAELLKKTPYEEEMQLCDYLSNYLSTTFLGGNDSAADAGAEETKASMAVEGAVEMASKKGNDEAYLVLGGRKKKGKQNKQKGGKGTRRGKIVLFPETIDAFSLLKMQPPTSLDQVQPCVDSLKEKKQYFSTLPRGEIVSIAEMNQKFDAQPDNRRARGENKGGKKQSSKFAADVNDTEAFPTLGGRTAAPAADAES